MRKMPEKRKANQRAVSLFRSQLRWLLRYGPALALMEEWDGTWAEGLCGILAEGLYQWISQSPEVSSEAVSLFLIEDEVCQANHVVVGIQTQGNGMPARWWYLDSDGVSSEATLLRIQHDEEGIEKPFLAPYDERLLMKYNIPRDPAKSARLAECFFQVFGSFSPSLLASK